MPAGAVEVTAIGHQYWWEFRYPKLGVVTAKAVMSDGALTPEKVKQGRVAAMTKAASYCLWNPAFSRVREYLLRNMTFMVSDSTGIPPELARKAGFIQETYGTFHGSYLDASKDYNEQFEALWAEQPHRKLSFRYGYVDSEKAYHLLVTRRAPSAPK